jgi:hypothetical protein
MSGVLKYPAVPHGQDIAKLAKLIIMHLKVYANIRISLTGKIEEQLVIPGGVFLGSCFFVSKTIID